MAANKRNLLLLFERPMEPVFMKKGKNNATFNVPSDLLSDRYKGKPELLERFSEEAGEVIPVPSKVSISEADWKVPMSLDRDEPFSLFIPHHSDIADHLIDIFMDQNIDNLENVAIAARERVNPVLFNYAFSVALLHRSDTKDLNLPLFAEAFPKKFIGTKEFRKAREEASVFSDDERSPIIIPKGYTASESEPEQRLWYFREDIGINLHHWHWHLVYPSKSKAGKSTIVDKDRRGELFYYMHQQIVARYNAERLSNNLARVKSLNLREPIAEAYFPKMEFPSRVANTHLKDLKRESEKIQYDVTDLERWSSHIVEACHQGFVLDALDHHIPLDERNGIDILGNIIESSSLSANPKLYGDLHNMGHLFISFSHDPDHRHSESFGVLGDTSTAMRDPVFYRWHGYIDDLFQEHKKRLPAYTTQALDYPGIRITGVTVQSNSGPSNTFHTFWQQSDVNVSPGMNFGPSGKSYMRFTHLQHESFTYSINITNNTGQQTTGTCRIFIAPINDEHGIPFLFRDQRLMMIELDKFTITLNTGENRVQRRSTESSVTIPYEQTFRGSGTSNEEGTKEDEQFKFCGCGWPQHMLIPKGTKGKGMSCDLFVMISNHKDDAVQQELVGTCNDAASYCGVLNRLYPDRRPMGFPFDRLAGTGVDRLQQFLKPNMFTVRCNIVHTDRTETRGML